MVGEVESPRAAMGSIEVVEVLVALPVGHPLAVPLELEALHGQERVDDRRAHRVADVRVGLERVERVARGTSAARRPAVLGRVGVAGERLAGLELAPHAVEAGEQRSRRSRGTGSRCRRRRGPRRGVARAALGRDADERRAVVPAPVGVGGREAVGDDPPVGVDGRVQERGQRGRVGEHAGGEVAQLGREPSLIVVGERVRRRRGPALKWMWKPEPPWSLNGLPMNVAMQPVDAPRRP